MAPKVKSPKMKNLHLPDDIILNILARITISQYDSLSLVSKRFYSLLSSPDIYAARSQIGNQEPRLYVSLNLPHSGDSSHHRWFTLTEPDQTLITNGSDKVEEVKGKLCLKPVKLSSPYESPRLHSTYVAVRSEIYQIGGTLNNKPSKAVRVLDCWSRTWRSAPDMLVARARAKSCFLDDKIYVVGGVRKTEKLNWGEVFDLKTQTWKPLPSPSDKKALGSRVKVEVLGERVCVHTESQDKYVYDPKDGRWVLEVGPVPLVIPNVPCCVIEDVMFALPSGGRCLWFKSEPGKWLPGKWLPVDGLGDLYNKISGYVHTETHQLANYGGKLVIIWYDNARDRTGRWNRGQDKTIWCAVIRLRFHGTEISGEVEGIKDLVKVPNSDMFLTSLSVTM